MKVSNYNFTVYVKPVNRQAMSTHGYKLNQLQKLFIIQAPQSRGQVILLLSRGRNADYSAPPAQIRT